ncbi:hypothetical protein V3C99_008504 [Haemonchus contortus]
MIVPFLLSILTAQSLQESAVRLKRQRSYYICGFYPNQYYSLSRCFYNQPSIGQYCSNGGLLIGVGCSYDFQCSPVSSVPSVCVNGCCCTSPVTTTTSLPTTDIGVYGYCYNGERSMMRCSSRMECSNGQTCVNGLCCKTTGDEWQNACAGLTAIASCTNGTCGSFFCTTSNYCCECQYGRTSGLCKDGCGPGFTCANNSYCCPVCPNGEIPYGSCYNGLCASGYSCRSGNICCSS